MRVIHAKTSDIFSLSLRLTTAFAGVFLIWSLVTAPAQAQNSGANIAAIEIVSLNYRQPDAIRAAIAPFLDSRGTLSQIDNKLIISTSSDNLVQLLNLIEELDVPRQQLRITVDFQYAMSVESLSDTSQLNVTSTLDRAQNVQSIVLTEGEYAYFSSNSAAPTISSTFTDQGLLLGQASSPQGSSFAVTAQNRGSRFLLELATLQSDTSPDGLARNTVLNTDVELAPGQWHLLNDTSSLDSSQDNMQVTSTQASELIAIMVELIP